MEAHLYRDLARSERTHWWYRGRRAVIREVLKQRLPHKAHRRVLDVGSGIGGMLEMLEGFGDVEAMESNADAIALTRESYGDRFRVHAGELPGGIPSEHKYDLLAAFDVIEHLDDPVAALAAMRAALEPGGWLVVTVPAFGFLWSEHDEVNHHRRRYTRAMLDEHLAAGGFTIEYASYFNSTLFAPIAAVRLAQKLLPGRKNGAPPRSDFAETPPLINAVLSRVFSAESLLLPKLSLPFGVSLIALARASG